MALNAIRVTPALIQRVDDNYPAVVARVRHALKCAHSGPDVPDLAFLRECVLGNTREVVVVVDGPTFACAGVVRVENQQLEWLLPNHDYDGAGGWPAAVAALCALMHSRLGAGLWGNVENQAVRDALLASGISGFTAKGTRMEWKP